MCGGMWSGVQGILLTGDFRRFAQRVIVSSLAVLVLNPLSALAEERASGRLLCKQEDFPCSVVTCSPGYAVDPKAQCNSQCDWTSTSQAVCCAGPNNTAELYCRL
ncbi:hypothetical protein BUE80_DR004720 [Diplocarpon rosae]|nr:hypothetical protein BUE80_DR004720 [Diplocarpon rosae]